MSGSIAGVPLTTDRMLRIICVLDFHVPRQLSQKQIDAPGIKSPGSYTTWSEAEFDWLPVLERQQPSALRWSEEFFMADA